MKALALALIGAALLCGCQLFRSVGAIRSGDSTVTGIADAGKPATLEKGETKSGVIIPAKTPVSITHIEAVPATDKTPFQPARDVVQFIPAFDTKLESVSTSLSANTGTVDTSIALKKIQVAENRILLYAALGAAAVGGFFIYRGYPTPAFICGGASLVFFAAWKLADLPEWFWMIGAAGIAAGAFLYIGHERGLKSVEVVVPAEKIVIPPS